MGRGEGRFQVKGKGWEGDNQKRELRADRDANARLQFCIGHAFIFKKTENVQQQNSQGISSSLQKHGCPTPDSRPGDRETLREGGEYEGGFRGRRF